MLRTVNQLILLFSALLVVPLIWLGVVALISWAGGWRSLADRYPGSEEPTGRAFVWRNSVGLSLFGTYNNCVHIVPDERGLHLRMTLFFRFNHPSIFIPWSAIRSCTQGRFFFQRSAVLSLGDSDSQLRIIGTAVPTVMEMYAFASKR